MGRNKISALIYLIVGLALIGLVSSLIKNPGKLFISILIAVGVAYILFMIFTRLLSNRSPEANDEMKKYRRAAKQSNKRYSQTSSNVQKKAVRKSVSTRTRRRRHAPHLTVIEGKKVNKDDNDRASN